MELNTECKLLLVADELFGESNHLNHVTEGEGIWVDRLGYFDPLNQEAAIIKVVKHFKLKVQPYSEKEWFVAKYDESVHVFSENLEEAIIDCAVKILEKTDD